ncbi:MAG: bifunctional oligoribonuclease/PAP phosphatase NrnA [Oscillospiraceae bacterium]
MNSITRTQCAEFLREHDNYLLMTHRRPDGDTLGSASALCLILRRLGKRAYLMANPEITPKYADFVSDLIAPEDWREDTLVAVDLAAETMFPETYRGNAIALCIDHHGSNTFYAGMTFVRPEKAACGEVVLELIDELGCGMDGRTASLLYIAISTDTGCFLYGNTTPDTHRAAAAVMAAGAEYGKLNKLLFRTMSEARMNLECMIYEGMRRYKNGEINIAVITLDMMAKTGATENDCDDLASIAGKIEGSKCSATIRETSPGVSKVSLRSGRHVNSSAVCARYGGGGHPMAAGCTMPYAPEEAREILAQAIIEAWQ